MTTTTAGEKMDRQYRYQRHFYDLTRKYFLLGRDALIEGLGPPPGGTVLEVGCGTGRNLVQAAKRYPNAQFFGLDISDEMLKSAAATIAKHKLSHQIALARADATDFSPEDLFGRAHFDRVFISYAVSMIPPWRQAIAAGLKAVAPGGHLSVVDFGQQERLPRLFRLALLRWLDKFHVTPRGDLESAMAEAAREHGGDLSFKRLYGGYAYLGRIDKV